MSQNVKCSVDYKRTKIVCTLGPATDNESVLRGMISAGMNVARLNLSHGTIDEHLPRMDSVRKISAELGEHVACMFDTRGPDIRIGDLSEPEVTLETGSEFILTANEITGNSESASVTFPGLPALVNPGDTIYLDDGMIELKAISSDSSEIRCEVVKGGPLKPRKGVNIPGKEIPLPVLTDEDISDLRKGIAAGIDYISASFVNSMEDVLFIRGAVAGGKGRGIPVISKIESAKGVANLESIIKASDGIMVARGDLGIEIPPENVPGVQKNMIRRCLEAGKPVITATEMLESMTRSSRPTRAEITDVANAVLDGTSAVMLSQETAVGKYPVDAVRMMSRICCRAEDTLPPDIHEHPGIAEHRTVREGIADAGCILAGDINAAAIICVTDSGATAAIFSHLRPRQPILACTPDEKVAHSLALYWGVIPVVVSEQDSVEALLKRATELGMARGLVTKGDRVVFTGNLSGRAGDTNLLAAVNA